MIVGVELVLMSMQKLYLTEDLEDLHQLIPMIWQIGAVAASRKAHFLMPVHPSSMHSTVDQDDPHRS